jgi:hypothetical protein
MALVITNKRQNTTRCVLSGAKPVRPILETGQTGFTQSAHKIGKLKSQLIHQTHMHHKLTLSHLETFRVHYTHCSTQYKRSQVQHIDKVQ